MDLPGKKKRGRPLGSKNKKKETTKKAKAKLAATADESFEAAFGHVETAPQDTLDEAEENFVVGNDSVALYEGDILQGGTLDDLIDAADDLDDGGSDDELNYEQQQQEDDDCNVGFGEADIFDIEELVGLGSENNGKDDILQDLRESCIAENSKSNYLSAITLLIFYNYKYYKYRLHKSWIQTLNSFSFNIQDENKKTSVIKKTIRKLLKNTKETAPPIDFDTYQAKDFMTYMLSLQRMKGDSEKRLGIGTYCNHRSALFHLYRMYGKKQSEAFGTDLTILLKGLKRKITSEQQSGNGRIQTGKVLLTYAMYRRLNELLLMEDTPESVFSGCFLCVTWNLMCRSANTVTIHLHHIEWREDCLAIYFAHMKNDQSGDRKRDPRHIYANPVDPVVCPLTALGIYLHTFGLSGTKSTALFPGTSQYDRFAKILKGFLRKHRDTLEKEFGINVDDLGVHSIRKGAATYVSSGSTCAPPQVATNIRAGWTMGHIQDTYLMFESAGDQYVGRVISGLPLSCSEFAALPPEFESTEDADIGFKMFPHLPSHMNRVARYLSASVLLSIETLHPIIPANHPFLLSSFMTSPSSLSIGKRIKLKYAWEDTSGVDIEGVSPSMIEQAQCNMLDSGTVPPPLEPVNRLSIPLGGGDKVRKATGIPVHVLLLAEMKKVILSQKAMIADLRLVVSSELDKRDIGSPPLQMQRSVEKLMSDFQVSITKKLDDVLPSSGKDYSNPGYGSIRSHTNTRGNVFYWGGKWKRVPENFVFPLDMGLSSAWAK